MFDAATKEKIIKALLFVFVVFLFGSFAYLIFSPKGAGPAKGAAKIYFFKDDKLVAVARNVSAMGDVKARADGLVAGPTKSEAAKGLFTEIPAGTKVRKAFIEGDTAYVDFSKKLGEYGGGSARVQGLIMQIVYTMTEMPGINKVGIMVDGKSEVVLGGEGYVIEKPLSRNDTGL